MPMGAKMRETSLQEELSDCVIACLLLPLAVCQEAQEIMLREGLPSEKVRTNQPTKCIASPTNREVISASNSAHAS